MTIRPATDADFADMWRIFQAVVATGDTYTFPADTSADEARAYFLADGMVSFVAECEDRVVGMYKLIPNHGGRGAHVANASFMVDPVEAGRGIGRQMGWHCLREARNRSYLAMQFNFVVSTNTRAVRLWQELGFTIAGTLPRVFRHKRLGDVDAYVMYRSLEDLPWADTTDVPIFGARVDGYPCVVRPSAYALIMNAAGELAIVRTTEGRLLPGGAIDPGETVAQAVAREVLEECAFEIESAGTVGHAVDFVLSAKEATCFEKQSTYVEARVVQETRHEPEHEVLWSNPADAIDQMKHAGHAWAIRRFLERGHPARG